MKPHEAQTVYRRPLGELPDPLPISCVERPFDISVRPPGSKSITNRAILLAALARGESELRGALVDADDAQVMLRAVAQLGVKVERVDLDGTPGVRVTGVGGRWRCGPGRHVLNLNNAGTATRFLTAAAILAPPGASIVIDGDARMRERPIAELTELLRELGVSCTSATGCPPVEVLPPTDLSALGASISVGTTASSQFISALMLIAPFLPRGLEIRFTGEVTSWPYIAMSRAVLEAAGAKANVDDHRRVSVGPASGGVLDRFTLAIEPDASGATYAYAMASVVPGARVTVPGLDLHPSRETLQGDTRFVSFLSAMGARVERLGNAMRVTGPGHLRGVDFDLADMPDTAMTAAALALFAEPTADNPSATTLLRGLRTLRVKETDRLEALRVELTRIGAEVAIVPDPSRSRDESLRITPPRDLLSCGKGVAFETYHDHRMAMALSLIGLRVPGVMIRDPKCVAKTYPGYFADLARVYG